MHELWSTWRAGGCFKSLSVLNRTGLGHLPLPSVMKLSILVLDYEEDVPFSYHFVNKFVICVTIDNLGTVSQATCLHVVFRSKQWQSQGTF